MSWQWIPAQLQETIGSDSLVAGTQTALDWFPGYYVGKDKDDGMMICKVSNERYPPIQSSNKWILTDYPHICLSATAYNENGDEEWTKTFYIIEPGVTIPISLTDDEQLYYAGKYVFFAGSYILQYSITENGYIIWNTAHSGYRGNDSASGTKTVPSEPVYSFDTMSGKVLGDYYWKSNVEQFGFHTQTTTFTLAGAVDRYKEQFDTNAITQIVVGVDFSHFWLYSSPSQFSSQETPPVGEYTNAVTGEKYLVGLASFLGSDNSVWTMNNYGLTSEYWMSEQHNGYSGRLYKPRNANYWGTAHSSRRPYYVCNTDLSSLYGQTSLTLQNQEYNSTTGAYEHIVSGDITLTQGPMQLVSSDSTILMGEVSMWR